MLLEARADRWGIGVEPDRCDESTISPFRHVSTAMLGGFAWTVFALGLSCFLGDTPVAAAENSPRPVKLGDTVLAMLPAGDPDTTCVTCLYHAEQSSRVAIDVRSLDFDTQVRVYRAAAGGTFEPLNEDDDGGLGTNSRLTFAATSGTSYRIEVLPWLDDWGGAVEVSVSPVAAPVLDWRARRQAVERYWSEVESHAQAAGNVQRLARAYYGEVLLLRGIL